MRVWLFCLLLTGLAFTGWSQTIEVSNDKLVINGSEILPGATLPLYEKILGKPDRFADLANNIYTYDNRGVYIYEDPSSLVVSNVAIQFRRQTMDFAPSTSFRGNFTINGYAITRDFTEDDLNSIPDVEVKNLGWALKVVAGEYDIYFSFEEQTNKVESIEISTVWAD